MQLSNYLDNLTEDSLVVLPTDRNDLITGTLVANYSNFSNVKGMVLYGGFEPDKSIIKILEGIQKKYSYNAC